MLAGVLQCRFGHIVGLEKGKSNCPREAVNVLLPCWFVMVMVHSVLYEPITSAVHTLGCLSAVGRDSCTDEDDAGKYVRSTGGVARVLGCVAADVSAGGVSPVPD